MKKNLLKYDLACGNNLGGGQKGFIGVDIVGKPHTQADIVWDLMKFPWEFAKDNSVDEVFASHFIEHIPHQTLEINRPGFDDPMFHFMDEIYRILKPGGLARFVAPYYTSVRAFQDPTHLRFISEPMFGYFTKAWRKLNKLEHYPVKCDFEIVKLDHAVSEEMNGKAQDAVAYQAMHMWNVVMDLQIILRKPKKKT